jgi:signal transduction histidine kinase
MDSFTKIRKIINIYQPDIFYTSATRIEILFNNLISNAIKYADVLKEDPYLQIEVNCRPDGASIRVTDNGEGIPEQSRAKIFDMFYRASGKGTGSGLGLYIVKEAIQKIGGTIVVNSEFGKGTEFVVEVPNLKGQ